MGKRLKKRELLKEIAAERERLMDLVVTIPVRKFNVPGINAAKWTIKDVLTHLIDWEKRTCDWCTIGKSDETPTLPDEKFKWSQIRDLNAVIQKRHSRKSVKRVLAELDEVHINTLAVIDGLTNKELTEIGFYAWTGNSWTVSDYLRANTASHYKWARTKIKRWLAKLD